ncbi:DUF1835 domain-containing protein [Bacillus salacetis]|uniref:DUF1835 domain-containing protein n=2 Tax=Bacillus salacetis TaxID=2315464 RepID=A0A3A1QZK6_9BACI|nr:DUF1835 domain-containing protein [Bacillus salacetis]
MNLLSSLSAIYDRIMKKGAEDLINDLKRLVQRSSEEEAKTLLLNFMLHINMQEEADSYTEKELVQNLKKTYRNFVEYKEKQSKQPDKDFKAAHILSGPSSAGGFKLALEEISAEKTDKIIAFSDIFTYGPLTNLHEESGQRNRHEWLRNHINGDYEYEDSEIYLNEFKDVLEQVASVPPEWPITIWTGDNVHEQTLLRFVMFLLKDKENEILIINTTSLYKKLFDTKEYSYQLLHTGEISIDKWTKLYKKSKELQPSSVQEKETYIEGWKALGASTDLLRVWEGNSVKSVEEGYYDDYIIDCAKRIQDKKKGFMKSARLIGEIIGHLEDYVGDGFIEYRVRKLVLDGIFDIKGIPKGMRFYSIRTRQPD